MSIKATTIRDGQIIKKPGVYRMSLDWYHQQCCDGPSTSSSELRKLFSDSPAHAWNESSLNPDREDKGGDTEKKNFILGRAAHHLLLGEEDFHTGFVVRPDEAPDGRAWHASNSSCKAWLEEQRKKKRTVLTPENIVQIRGMAVALGANSYVRQGILEGDVELSLIYRDKKTGIWVKNRPDVIPTHSGDFADLKTTSFYGWDLDRQARDHRYDMQAALSKWGCKEVLDLDLVSFSFVFASVKRPHMVDILTAHPDDMAYAEKDLRTALDTLAWCLKNGNWFGPSGTQERDRPILFNRIEDNRFRDENTRRRERLAAEIAAAESVTQYGNAVDRLSAG